MVIFLTAIFIKIVSLGKKPLAFFVMKNDIVV